MVDENVKRLLAEIEQLLHELNRSLIFYKSRFGKLQARAGELDKLQNPYSVGSQLDKLNDAN